MSEASSVVLNIANSILTSSPVLNTPQVCMFGIVYVNNCSIDGFEFRPQ